MKREWLSWLKFYVNCGKSCKARALMGPHSHLVLKCSTPVPGMAVHTDSYHAKTPQNRPVYQEATAIEALNCLLIWHLAISERQKFWIVTDCSAQQA